MSEVLKHIWPFLRLSKRYGFRFSISFLLALATLVASVGLLALSGWFITATAVAGLSVATAQSFNFLTPGAGVRGFSIARTAGRYGERLVSHDATFRLLAGLRVWFFERVEPLAPAGLKNFRQADLLNRLVADIDTLDGLYLRLVSPLLVATAGSLALVGLAAWFSTSVALALAVVLAGCLLVLPPLFFQMGKTPGEQVVVHRSQLRTRILDFVAGQTELHLSGALGAYREKVVQAETEMLAAERQVSTVTARSLLAITVLTGFTVALVFWLGFQDPALAGPLVVMLVLATMAAFEAVMPLPGAFQMLGQTGRAAERLREVAEQKAEVVFPENSQVQAASQGALSLEKVSFHYPSGSSVLKDFSVALQPGERVALTGATGCGKSTILQLITRDWNTTGGQIKLDGAPVDQFSERDLRGRMAVMPQRIHVFSASLRDNLLLACSADAPASDQVLLQVLQQVGLDHLAPAEQLLDVWFGAAGQALSGGEQRRLGLARVLLRLRDENCRLVLLDEPTEGLDPETEQSMVSLLSHSLAGKTLLVITHRPALLALAARRISV